MQLLIDQRNQDNKLDEKYFADIEKAIKVALEKAGYGSDYEVSLSIVDEDEIQELNREYRDKDSITDVLSFPLYEKDHVEESGMLGDIVICHKRAFDQADEFGHSYEREIIYLTVHSVLHLLGYDHENEEDKLEMRTLEKEIMNELEVYK